MKIILNNREETFSESVLTIEQLLAIKHFTFKMLVVKVNGDLVKKTDYATTTIADGDRVMVLHLISGG